MNSEVTPDVVLVVDDSPEALAMLNEALEQAGLTVLIALEGKQAINIAQKMVPDIIVLDAIMPSMDGFETCQPSATRCGLKCSMRCILNRVEGSFPHQPSKRFIV